jgi:hypothetical protein
MTELSMDEQVARFAAMEKLAPRFKAPKKLQNRGGYSDYSIDFDSEIICNELSASSVLYYEFCDALTCEVVVDDKTVIETSTGSMIGRGLVGGVLLGGVGLLLGGATATKNKKVEIKKVVLNLTFRGDITKGGHSLTLFQPGHFTGENAEQAVALAERIHDAIGRAKTRANGIAGGTPDLADQLMRLANLHANGALTAEEFKAAKSRLL